VTFYGNVTVDQVPGARMVVTLVADVSTGWSASVAPSSMVFASAGSVQNFQVSVVVPPGEPASSIGQLTITARGTSAGLQCPPAQASAIITPRAYYGPWVATLSPNSAEARAATNSVLYVLNVSYVSNAEAPGSIPLDLEVPGGATHDAPAQIGLTTKGGGIYNATIEIRVRTASVANGTYQISARLGASPGQPQGVAMANASLTVPPRSVAGDPAPAALALVVASAAAGFASARRASSRSEEPVEGPRLSHRLLRFQRKGG
jgi:hypothetical protein